MDSMIDLLAALTIQQMLVGSFALGLLLGMVCGAVVAVIVVGADIGRMAE
jgi:hypothetical protein